MCRWGHSFPKRGAQWLSASVWWLPLPPSGTGVCGFGGRKAESPAEVTRAKLLKPSPGYQPAGSCGPWGLRRQLSLRPLCWHLLGTLMERRGAWVLAGRVFVGLLLWYHHNCTLDCPTVPSQGRTARVCLGAPIPISTLFWFTLPQTARGPSP